MKWFPVCLCLLSLLSLIPFFWGNVYKFHFSEQRVGPLKDFEIFLKDWCHFRQLRTNFSTVIGPCKDQIRWDSRIPGVPTNASKSFIASWDLKPAGEFSRFFIQAVSSDGQLKTSGGDWWRVMIRGTASTKPAVFDLGNGTYEVLFLLVEPGIYDVEIVLDYTLCDGFRDPPDNWFVIGTSQGRHQPAGVLKEHAKDYRLEPFHGGRQLIINIRLANEKGFYMFNTLPKKSLSNLLSNLDLRCGMKCNMIWDGYGRWNGGKWKPYLKAKHPGTNYQKSTVKKSKSSRYDTLWIYGDSHSLRMHSEVINTSLCRSIFTSCKVSNNWVYRVDRDRKPHRDELDFNYRKIINELAEVLVLPELSKNSVMVLNFGVHYVLTTNISNYEKLLRGVVALVKENPEQGKRSIRMIWKTTTPLSKEKGKQQYIHEDWRRFFNNPRIAMFNAYATSLMCREGFELLDIHPLTGSYPHGTGRPNVEGAPEQDIVHYEPVVMVPFQEALVDYLSGKIPEKLSLEDYEFS